MLLLHGLGGDEVELLRHRRRAQPPLPRPRDRPARLRRQLQAADRALRRPYFAKARDRRRWTRWASSAPTSSATAWAGGWRSRSACERPDRVGGIALLSPAVAFVRRDWHWLVRFARPELGMLPHSLGRAAHRADVLGAVRRPRPRRPERGRHRRRRVRAHLPLAGRAAGVPRLRPRDLPREPVRPQGLLPAALRRCEPPALFVWASHDRLIPERFRHHVERWLPERRAGRPRGLRPRPAGRAPGAHERAAGAVLRARRPARRLPPASGLTGVDDIAMTATATRNGHGDPEAAREALRAAGGRLRRPQALRRAAACRSPTSTSATRTTSARRSRACGCSPVAVVPRRGARPRQRARGRARCCWSATTPAAT